MGKLARDIAVALDEEHAAQEGLNRVSGKKVPFDSTVWQVQDDGDYVHIKTGEVRSAESFGFGSEDESDTGYQDDDFGSQDTGDDGDGSQVRGGGRKR